MTPIYVAVIGGAGVVVGVFITGLMTRWNEDVARRRAGYADAVRALVAYRELPYRIRRRSSDSQEDLRRLADLGHDIQETLRYYRAWVRSENRWAGALLDDVVCRIATRIGPACREAWEMPPVKKASSMNLGDWGPGVEVDDEIGRFERGMLNRFGLPRGAGLVRWHPVGVPPPILLLPEQNRPL